MTRDYSITFAATENVTTLVSTVGRKGIAISPFYPDLLDCLGRSLLKAKPSVVR